MLFRSAETEELPSAKALSVEPESTDSEEQSHVQGDPVVVRSTAEVAVDDSPSETLEVSVKQASRFRRRQSADRGR